MPENNNYIKRPIIEESWFEVLEDEFEKEYFISLKEFLKVEKKKYDIFPPGPDIFNAFKFTPLPAVRVVILGQDPYHGPGQAHGLCFSVPKGIVMPPSLVNIFKEMSSDMFTKIPTSGNLEKWADQGVLLLNATLTVRSGQAGSHQGRGWEIFTDKVIESVSELRAGVVFLLWGKYAMAKQSLIDTNKHFILTAAHPSPLSAFRGFFGCHHFSKANQLLSDNGLGTIDWKLT